MREFIVLLVHSIATLVQLAKPGGLRSVVAESVLVRHQLLILNRGRKPAPNLCAANRILAGLCTLLMCPARVLPSAIVRKPSTFLHCHNLLKKLLFSHNSGRQPGPKGPKKEMSTPWSQ